jgi:hypothetical protein
MSVANSASLAFSAMVRTMKPPGSSCRHQTGNSFAQGLTLGFDLNALRNPDVFFLRQIDQHAAGNGNLRRQPRTLGADRVLDDLDDDALAFRQHFFDRPLGRRFARLPDIGDMQERGASRPTSTKADCMPGRMRQIRPR